MEILVKREKIYKYFVLECLKIFLLGFILLKNKRKLQKLSVFSRKSKNIFVINALLQLGRLLLPGLYLTQKCKTVFFEIYLIYTFVASQLLIITVVRTNESLQLPASTENLNLKGSWLS